MNIKIPVLFEDEPIDMLELNTRSYHACRQNSVVTIGDLAEAIGSPRGIDKWRNVGASTIKEIKSKLFNYMFENAPDPDAYAQRVIDLTFGGK